jgi:succinoglycan biosynthesis protein ExoA
MVTLSTNGIVPNAGELPFVSIVIPVRNEERHLGAVLAHLQLQDYPQSRFEIIVVDGDSTDGTREVVENFQRTSLTAVRLLHNPMRLSSAGRNVGARVARGEYIFFIDGHCVIPSKSMLSDAVLLFENTGCDCLCRPQPLTVDGIGRIQAVVAHARGTAFGHGTDSTIYNTEYEGPIEPMSAGALYRKSVFSKIGYYDESFDACEDVEFNFRVFKAGLKSWISPKLTVLYHPRGSFNGLWKQMMRYGRGRCRLVCKHPDALTFGQLVPALFLLWIFTAAVGSVLWLGFSLLLAFSFGIYFATALVFAISLARRYGLGHFFLSPLAFMTIHFGLGAGFLADTSKIIKKRLVSGVPSYRRHVEGPEVEANGSRRNRSA